MEGLAPVKCNATISVLTESSRIVQQPNLMPIAHLCGELLEPPGGRTRWVRDIGNGGSVMPAMCLLFDAAIRRVAVIARNPRPHSHRRGQQHLVAALYAGWTATLCPGGSEVLLGERLRRPHVATRGWQGGGGGGGGSRNSHKDTHFH